MSNFTFFIWLIVLLGIAFFPMLLSFISWMSSGFKGSMWSEGPGGHGAYMWLMLITLPLGGFGALMVLVKKIIVWLQ